MKRILFTLIAGLLVLIGVHAAHADDANLQTATVFFNEACGGCSSLVLGEYPELFAEYDVDMETLDYINNRDNRRLLTKYNSDWKVPFELQSHIEAFVGESLLIGGHVPEGIVRYLLENPDKYNKILVFQDKMRNAKFYKVWDFKGEIKTYDINEPITTYLKDAKKNLSTGTLENVARGGFWGLFSVISVSAFLDGLNPCAFAVLLFFIAFLYTIKKSKSSIWRMGIVYIFAIYLAYFLIGIGIAQAIIIAGYPHLMAKVGSYLVISLGVLHLLGVVFPKFPIKLRIPVNTKATVEKWLYKATLPASFIGGFVVGLCTFPCSGGVYVAIIGLLASSQTYLSGLGWMVWYNFIFVTPLIILLLLAANKKTTERLHRLERSKAKYAKVLAAVTMIVLGLVILLFFT